MLLIPLHTALLKTGDDLAQIISDAMSSRVARGGDASVTRDILVVSSKAVATVEGAAIDLATMTPSDRARDLSTQTGRSPAFCEAMLRELARLHGTVVGTCPGAALIELRPDGLSTGTILVANAGLDESNVPEGMAIGWPVDPVQSVRKLRETMKVAVIITDSICMPRRSGVTAIALAVSGLDPLRSQKGKNDLFHKPLHITTEAIADQLSTAANFLMGNAGQSVPAVLIRDHGLELSEWEGWVPGIEPDQDLFKEVI